MARPVAVLDANVFPTTWLLDILFFPIFYAHSASGFESTKYVRQI